jgi:antitoxin CcdA
MNAPTRHRKATNLSLDADLLDEAKALGINVSRAAEGGVARAVALEKGRLWQQENAAALESSNAWVVERGLPLKSRRMF